jgi:hypothetical protein
MTLLAISTALLQEPETAHPARLKSTIRRALEDNQRFRLSSREIAVGTFYERQSGPQRPILSRPIANTALQSNRSMIMRQRVLAPAMLRRCPTTYTSNHCAWFMPADINDASVKEVRQQDYPSATI